MLPVFYSLEQFYKRKHVLFILRLQHDYVVWDIDDVGILFNDRWVKGGYLIYTTPAAQSEPLCLTYDTDAQNSIYRSM